MPTARAISVCLWLLAWAAGPAAARPPARPAQPKASRASPATAEAHPKDKGAEAVQVKKLEAAERSLEKLRADKRRRRYRDGWEAIAQGLSGASKLDGTRAAACALRAAEVREELWGVSRAKGDALGSVTAYRGVVERFPGSAEAGRALAAARRLASRTGLAREVRELAQKGSKSQKGAAPAPAQAARQAGPVEAAPLERLRAATASDRDAQVPVDGEEAEEEEPALPQSWPVNI